MCICSLFRLDKGVVTFFLETTCHLLAFDHYFHLCLFQAVQWKKESYTKLLEFIASFDEIIKTLLSSKLNNDSYDIVGGYCFKPMTCKDGLKLFEMETVLSMELRKPKEETDPSVLTSVVGGVVPHQFHRKLPPCFM